MDLKSNQKSIGYSHDIPTTILPMGTSCQPGNCFMSQGSQLVKTVDDISPPETYRAPSGTMKASQWGGRPPSLYQVDFSMSYEQNVCCLLQ